MIWTDNYLDQLGSDGAKRVNIEVPFLFHRFYLATTANQSVYTLNPKVKSIRSITWRGVKLDPLSWEEAVILYPGLAYVDGSTNIEGSSSTPAHYLQHPTNARDIRLLPTPDESLSASGGDPYSPSTDEARCTITCWRYVDLNDSEASLPDYIDRRIRKAYSLWKAYAKEGDGQDLKASEYYKQKFYFYIEQFRLINSAVFVSKRRSLQNSTSRSGRPPKPRLPANFERVVY